MAGEINSTTMWTPGTGYLNTTGTLTPEEQARAAAAGQPIQNPYASPSAYVQGATSANPLGGTNPVNPNQFATEQTAQQIAAMNGGTTYGLQLEGPGYGFSTPQQQILYPNGVSQNAGLAATAYGNYGTNPYGYGQFQVSRDAQGNYGQNYNQWALSQPGFQMDPRLANSGPGYNFVPDGKGGFINTANPTGGAMSQQQAISFMQQAANPAPAPSGTMSGVQRPAGTAPPGATPPPSGTSAGQQSQSLMQNLYSSQSPTQTRTAVTQPTASTATRTIATSPVTRSAPQTPFTAPSAGAVFEGPNGTQFKWTGEGWEQVKAGTGETQDSAPTAGTMFQGLDGRNFSWSGSGWDAAGGDAGGEVGGGDTGGGADSGGSPPPSGGPSGGYAPSGGGYAPSGSAYAPLSQYTENRNPYQQFRYGSNTQPLYNGVDAYTGGDITEMARNDRNLALGGGGALAQNLQNYTNYQAGRSGDLNDRLDSAYGGIASGYGGYSDAEKQAILNNPYLRSLQLSPEQAQGNYLTDWEQAGIAGEPWRPYYQLGLDEQSMDRTADSRDQYVRDALGYQDNSINDNLRAAGTGVRGAVYNQRRAMRNDLSDIAALTRGELDTAGNNIRGALNYGEDYARSYLDPNKLGLSDEYRRNYNVSPQDMQNIRNKAGRTVAAQEAMDEQNLAQQANAQGNTSPLAIEAARNRMRQMGAVNAANAMSNADIAAKELQLNTSQNRENTRLGAEQNYAGLGSNTELNLGARRTGAEQAIGSARTANEQFMGDRSLDTERTLGAAEQGAEQYLGSLNNQAQQYLGGSRVGAEQALGAGRMGAEQWKTGTNLGAGQTAEQAGSSRAGQLATNRQGTNIGNQAAQFQRGQYIYGNENQTNTNFANQRLGQEQEYRGYLTGQQNQANQNVTIGNQQQIQNQGQTVQGATGATNTAINNYAIPGFWKQVVGSLAKGGVSAGPHMALVGEAGPELVIDLEKLPHYGGGFNPYDPYAGGEYQGAMDTYGMSPYTDGSGEGEGPEGSALPTDVAGRRVKRGQDLPENPIYTAIRKGAALGGYGQGGGSAGQQAQQPVRGGGLIGDALGIAKLFLAKGGVVGGHPYGHRGQPKVPHVRAELVTGPQIRQLGVYGAQAVLPLNRKKGNHVTPEMLPDLIRQYGG